MDGPNWSIVLLIKYVSEPDLSLTAEPKAKQKLNSAIDNDPELYFRTLRWTGSLGKPPGIDTTVYALQIRKGLDKMSD